MTVSQTPSSDQPSISPSSALSPEAVDAVESANATESSAGSKVEVVTERLKGRQRRLTARLRVPCGAEQIWRVLVDYDRLADFVPNLTRSQRIPHPDGGIRLEQVGAQCFLNLKFCARVVLDMTEQFPQKIGFSMVEGDFKQFNGAWHLVALGPTLTELVYELEVLPPLAMPAGLIERHLSHNLSENLRAIYQQSTGLPAPA